MDVSDWKNAYKIGVSRIDAQHAQLIKQWEKLLAAMELCDDELRKEECADIIAFTQYYAAAHFIEEEHYQELIDFPGRELHKKLHESFAKKTAEFVTRLQQTDYAPGVVQELTQYMEDWFVYHIAGEDKKMIHPSHAYIE